MKFHKKYIKALKEGKLAMIDADKYPEIAQGVLDKAFPDDGVRLIKRINHIFPIIIAIEEDNNYWYTIEQTELPTKSAKDFIKPSIKTLTENDVVVCDSEVQRVKVIEAVKNLNKEKTVFYAIVGETVPEKYVGKNIIPYSDLFPKKKKSSWKRNIEKQIKQINISMFAYGIVKVMEDAEEKYKRADPKYKQDVNKQAILCDRKPEKILTPKGQKIEVSEQSKTDTIDWNKPGYYKSIYNNLVVYSNGRNEKNDFSGTVLIPDGAYVMAEYSGLFGKECFKPCTEDITIKINE